MSSENLLSAWHVSLYDDRSEAEFPVACLALRSAFVEVLVELSRYGYRCSMCDAGSWAKAVRVCLLGKRFFLMPGLDGLDGSDHPGRLSFDQLRLSRSCHDFCLVKFLTKVKITK